MGNLLEASNKSFLPVDQLARVGPFTEEVDIKFIQLGKRDVNKRAVFDRPRNPRGS